MKAATRLRQTGQFRHRGNEQVGLSAKQRAQQRGRSQRSRRA
jgi:hypothetical protein